MFSKKPQSNAFQATYKDKVIAQSANTIVVEGNQYFPPSDVDFSVLKDSSNHTVCGWKGTASYFDVEVDKDTLKDAAFTYPEAKDAAKEIEGYLAFWNGVNVQSVDTDKLDGNFAPTGKQKTIEEGTC